MIQSDLAPAALKLFFAITPAEIDRDIAATSDDFDAFWPKIQAFYRIPRDKVTAEDYSRYYHTQMLLACSGRAHPQIPDIIPIHFATVTAREVAQAAIDCAYEKNELGKLNAEIDRIREKHGIDDEEENWEGKEKPARYDDLVERAGELLSRIDTTMVHHVLRRYHFDDYVQMMEADPDGFNQKVIDGHALLYRKAKDG